MVLGFGSRSSKKKGKGSGEHVVRMSPSLPEMSTQGLSWPSSLVDVASIRETPPQTPAPGATKVSFSSADHGAIPFHRPFRVSSSRAPSLNEGGRSAGPIASLYMMSHPPSAFSSKPPTERAGTPHSTRTRHSRSQRRRVAPTFNLMVAGAQGTGKSSLLRLLIDTADISPAASAEQRSSMDQFLRASGKRTERIGTACVEICESRFDRVLLSVIDTPGLDFQEGRELKLERQVSGIMKYLDLQYADTMGEESKVVRKSKGDQHVHLCIYLIDPDSIMTPSTRRPLPLFPAKDEPVLGKEVQTEQDQELLTMNPADLRVIRRLSERVNVLPIVSRSDVLTDEKLTAVKLAIRRDLHNAKLGFSVFGPAKVDEEVVVRPVASPDNSNESGSGSGQQTDEGFGGEESEEEEERRSRPVIKLNQNRRPLTRSTSRSRLERSDLEEKRAPMPLSEADPESLASVRFSAAYFAAQRTPGLADAMPFAVIMPEQSSRMRRALKAPPLLRPVSTYSTDTSGYPQTPVTQNGDVEEGADVKSDRGTPTPTAVMKSDHLPYMDGAPRDLKGVFVRRFRWGVVDVLDPMHCDFAALRTAVLSTHFKVLKMNTKEVLYEKYRTEKLLARRATRNISDEDRKRLLEELGL